MWIIQNSKESQKTISHLNLLHLQLLKDNSTERKTPEDTGFISLVQGH